MMKKYIPVYLPVILLFTLSLSSRNAVAIDDDNFDIRIVADKLSDPWEVTYGPDGFLWITEAKGYRILRINPRNNKRQVLADLSGLREFPRYDKIPDQQDGGKPWPQGGLMGLALHPDLLKDKPYVYAAYVYRFHGASLPGDGKEGDGYHFSTRIVRFTYQPKKGKLTDALVLCDTIPGSNDHNGGRLVIAPVNGKPYLFYSVGDMGAGQYMNGGRTNKAQQASSYEGKILRFNLEPDADRNEGHRHIPDDNPFNGEGQSAVWSTGHRNPQGLAYGTIQGKAILYATEHGAYSDDEINRIDAGGNYGHPLVMGYDDGNYDGLAASVSDKQEYSGIWHSSYPLIKNEKQHAAAIGKSYRNPIKSFYPTSNSILSALYENIRNKKEVHWQSFAPSGLTFYQSDAIPGWKNSLLIPTLKGQRLLRLKLDKDGNIADDTLHEYVKGNVRYRDVAVSADGLRIYLAVDSSAVSSGPSKEKPRDISYRGCILELKYKQR